MPLLDLANEVLLFVVQGLELVRDINAFSQSNRRLQALLNRYLYRFDIEQFSAEGLLWAVTRGNEKTVQTYLAEGAVPTPKALTIAVGQGHETIVALLLEKGADPNGWNGQSRSALNTAAYRCRGHSTFRPRLRYQCSRHSL
jgi:ankyrin repeat protein